ncbi:hypothetical protein WJX77_011726 [Trebouxia sp. C0004]
MYDFCFTFPYSALLALGGLIGFVSKGSLPSLVGGLTSAGILAACAYASLASYRQGKIYRPATVLSLCIATALTIMMWRRYQKTQKVMPAGFTAALSFAMSFHEGQVTHMWQQEIIG